MSKKKLPPDILERLESSRKIYLALRRWHSAQIQRLDRTWGNEGTRLLDSNLLFQKISLDRLEVALQKFIDASPAEALSATLEATEK